MFTCLFDVIGYDFARIYVFMHFFSCFMLRSTSIHLCAWIHVLPCLCAKFLHVYMHVSMPICLYLYFHMLVCSDLCSLHALYFFPCACVLYAMFVCLGLDLVCHAMCFYSPFVTSSFFLVFWPIGSDLI